MKLAEHTLVRENAQALFLIKLALFPNARDSVRYGNIIPIVRALRARHASKIVPRKRYLRSHGNSREKKEAFD